MSDLKFNIVVSAESAQASSRALTSDLKDTENQANKTADAGQALGDKMGQGASTAAKGVTELAGALGGAKQSTDQFGASSEEVIGMTARQKAMLEAIQGPMREYQENIKAVSQLLMMGKIDEQEYQDQLIKMQRATGDTSLLTSQWAASLEREAAVFDRIRGPMEKYEADVAALDNLMQKGRITALEYENEFAKLAKQYGTMHGPVAPQNAVEPDRSQGDSSAVLSSVATGANALLAGGAAAGIVSLGEHLEGLIRGFQDVQDVAITAANSVQRFTDANHALIVVQDQQIELAHELHATYTQAATLYGKLAEGADALGLSQGEITKLTKEFGEAVEISGKPLEAADGIMRRFSYSVAAGKIEVREMRTLMREMPAIADLWSKSFNATRAELVQMVKDGRVSTEDLTNALLSGGKAIDDQYQKIKETHKQATDQWLEDEKILSQRYDVATGSGHGAQDLVDTFRRQLESGTNVESVRTIAEHGLGDYKKLAQAAIDQYNAASQASIADFIKDAHELTGVFRPLGDAYRQWTGDTAVARAEITKLNEPVESAKREMVVLDQVFQSGKIGVDEYTKRWATLQTTIGHGIGSQALKITEPIRIAKAELDRLNNEIEAGANVTQAEYRKAMTQYATAQHGGVIPEELKLNNPVADAKDALIDLEKAQAQGRITGEAFRKEYDALMTTINDGRLPAAIKLMEGLTLPLRDAEDGVRAVDALFRAGKLSISEYSLEIGKAEDALYKLIAAQAQTLPGNLAQKAAPRSAFGGQAEVRYDVRDDLAAYNARLNVEAEQAEFFRTRQSQFASAQERQQHDAQAAKYGLSNDVGVQAALTAANAYQSSDSYKKLTEELNKAQVAAAAFYEPQVKYEQTLKAISEALNLNSISQEQATAAQRRAKDEYNAAEEALAATKGPLEQYEAALRKLNDQQEANNISLAKYRKGVDDARVAFLQATGAASTFKGAMEIEWIKMKQDADSFGASLAKVAVQDLDKVNDAIITAANHGAVSWTAMVDSMIQDLERLILKQLEVQALNAVIGALGGGGGAAVASGVASAADAATAADAANAAAAAAALRTATPTTVVGAYPTSGVSTVSSASTVQQSIAPKVVIVNQYDKNLPLAAMDSRQGQMQTVNALRANQAAVRSYSGMRQ